MTMMASRIVEFLAGLGGLVIAMLGSIGRLARFAATAVTRGLAPPWVRAVRRGAVGSGGGASDRNRWDLLGRCACRGSVGTRKRPRGGCACGARLTPTSPLPSTADARPVRAEHHGPEPGAPVKVSGIKVGKVERSRRSDKIRATIRACLALGSASFSNRASVERLLKSIGAGGWNP